MGIAKSAFEYSRGAMFNLKKNWKTFSLLFLFTLGILLGTYILKENSEIIEDVLSNIFTVYIKSKKEQSIAKSFLNSFGINFIFLIISFILGLCAVGTPLITIIPIIKGIGIGLLCGYLYLKYNFSGLGYCVLIIYPGLIISMFSLLSACNFSLSFSYNTLLKVSGNCKSVQGESDLKIFCIRYIILLCISTLSSVVDSITIRLFSNLFNF